MTVRGPITGMQVIWADENNRFVREVLIPRYGRGPFVIDSFLEEEPQRPLLDRWKVTLKNGEAPLYEEDGKGERQFRWSYLKPVSFMPEAAAV